MMTSTNKYWYGYAVQGHYGFGWEDLILEDTLSEAKLRVKEYRENERGVSHRVVKVRRLNEDYVPKVKQSTLKGEKTTVKKVFTFKRNAKGNYVDENGLDTGCATTWGIARKWNKKHGYPDVTYSTEGKNGQILHIKIK